MIARSSVHHFRGIDLPVISAEDLMVIKALVHDEHNPRHWGDALAVITRCELDWGYVQRRARHGRRRVISLLLYAQSNDLPVPDSAVESLMAELPFQLTAGSE